ncbi:unnamed protein product [Gulo gulo]|uniref:Uncharacterized protein n=1 Tax=Gulo gulo TaxID=48420 RepID=A0A9X9LCD8_GULGU|nr:unnamed protein product [Gulo gulo]
MLLLLFFNSEFWWEKCVNNQTATLTAPYENKKFNMTHTSFLNEKTHYYSFSGTESHAGFPLVPCLRAPLC